jgi:hypothetical protein
MRAAFAKCFFLRTAHLCLGVHYDEVEGCVWGDWAAAG